MTDSQGVSIWKRSQRMMASVNLGLSASRQAIATGEVTFACPEKSSRKLKIEDMGIALLKRDSGTGYHQPYGSLLLYGKNIEHDDSRSEIESVGIRPAILQLMNISK
jgi:hypothetical protein